MFLSLLRINLSFYKRLTTLNQKLKVGKIKMDRPVIANPHAVRKDAPVRALGYLVVTIAIVEQGEILARIV